MQRFAPLLLPFLAALFVAVLAVAVHGRTRSEDAPELASASSTERATPAETPKANLPRAGDVCQEGVVNRPTKGEPIQFSPVYTRRRTVLGISIVGTELVNEAAFDVAEATIRVVLADPALRDPLVDEGAYVIIADATQGVLDLPEFACLAGSSRASVYDHACGVADWADYPVVTVNELDLAGDGRGPCRGLNILYHELGHLIQGWALGPADWVDVRLRYQEAIDGGKYRDEYAARNTREYFAEATQAYFLSVDPEGRRDREWLRGYDPGIYSLLEGVFGD